MMSRLKLYMYSGKRKDAGFADNAVKGGVALAQASEPLDERYTGGVYYSRDGDWGRIRLRAGNSAVLCRLW